jgi:L-threonylcarbamoyladenylate synthase
LLPKKDIIPDEVTSGLFECFVLTLFLRNEIGLPRVAIRVPNHPLALELLRSVDFPLAAPSANPFGYISPTSAQHVVDQLGGLLPYVLDGGPCRVGVESTIVGFEEGDVVVYRLGGVSVEALQDLCGKDAAVRVEVVHSSNPAAPGMLKSHYAPSKPLFLVPFGAPVPQSDQHRRVGLISVVARGGEWSKQTSLCPSGNTDGGEAAQHLFAALRLMDNADVDVIFAEECPATGLGRAVNDRLKRAACKE